MKKLFVCLSVLALASCYYLKGDYTLGRRNTFNDFFYTYNIRFYEDMEDDFTSETRTVNNYSIGEAKHAATGEVMLSSSVIYNDIVTAEYVRPNMKGALVSYTVPVDFSDEKLYKVIGETEINGVMYRLIEPNRFGDVVLIDDRGYIYRRVGRIYNGRLALLETQFVLEPADIRFTSDIDKFDGSNVFSGFSVRYLGLSGNHLRFAYTVIQPGDGASWEEERVYRFPRSDRTINMEGIVLEILGATASGIDYKLQSI